MLYCRPLRSGRPLPAILRVNSVTEAPRVAAPRLPVAWLLLPFALGYGASYFFRNVNAVAGPLLAAEFGLDAGGLGFLTSAYFLAFSLAQIPLGLALDRFGPARVDAVMLATAAAGATVFACADSVAMLGVGRAMIGLGAGAALMSAMSAVHLWVRRERAATAIGLITTAGGIGALLASTPTQLLIAALGWRQVFLLLAAICALTALAILATGRHAGAAASGEGLGALLAGAGRVYASRHFWMLALPMMMILGTMLAFQSLWAATWMRDVAGYADAVAIGNVLLCFNIGLTCAFVLSGWLVDTLRSRGIAPLTTLKGYCAVAFLAQAWLLLMPGWLPHLAWGLMAFGANSLMAGYALVAARFPPGMTGRVNTAANLMVFASAFVMQWGFGMILNLWPGSAGGYAVGGYYAAWAVLLLLQLAAWTWLVVATRTMAAGAKERS